MINKTEVDLEKIEVMYVEAEEGPKGATKAFNKLESKLPSLKRRKFYGIVFGTPPNLDYWASVALFPDDDPKNFGLPTYTIPSGKHIQTKLKDWNNNTDKIAILFSEITKGVKVDTTRPSIEFYRSMDELLLRVPIKD